MFQKDRIRKILSGAATIVSFLFVAAILALIAFATLMFVAAGPVAADPLYNRWLLLLEWRDQIGMIPVVYKLIFVGLFFLAVYRIFGWFKARRENKSKMSNRDL